MLPFSGLHRAEHLRAMATGTLDLLVIGGGITGAGVAWDATLRGLRVGLVEMQDFAAGTSSRSTKLIHGGLRYLEQGDWGLVREAGRERAILHRLAPHVVHPLWMLLPFAPQGRRDGRLVSLGTWVYDRLAGTERADRRRMLDTAAARLAEPLLRADVGGAARYLEYATDDARLTLEVLKSAVSRGAFVANYAEATGFGRDGSGRLRAVHVVDRVLGGSYEIPARTVVNAAGPWVDRVLDMDASSDRGPKLRLSKGVHAVLRPGRLPLRQAVYFERRDGRLLFAVPRGLVTYLGTTDTEYAGDRERPVATSDDVAYLVEAARAMFPAAALGPEDVAATWAGLRPLLAQAGRSTAQTSRRDALMVSPSGLVTIAGGKLTGFRRMAERVVDRVLLAQGSAPHPSLTALKTLSGAPAGGPAGLNTEGAAWAREGVRHGMPPQEAEALASRYGANTPRVFAHLSKGGPDAAEAAYAIHDEMAVHATDILVRRTGTLPFAPDRLPRHAQTVLAALVAAYGLSGEQQSEERRAIEAARREATDALKADAASDPSVEAQAAQRPLA